MIVVLLICLVGVWCEPDLSMTANTKNAFKGRLGGKYRQIRNHGLRMANKR